MAKAEWLIISPTSGSGNADVTNSASKYEGREARSTEVTGIAVGVTPDKTYTVVQEGKEEFIEVDSIGSVDADGGTVTITGRSNAKGLTIEALKDGDNVEASVTLSESYTAGGQTTVNGAEIAGDPGAADTYEFAMDITVGENNSASVATAIIRITGSDGAQVSATLAQVASVAILVNAADSSDVHLFDSCEDAATYATANSETNWHLTINSGEIPRACFQGLTNLVSLTLEEGVTKTNYDAFKSCTGLTGDLVIPNSFTEVGSWSFQSCTGLTGKLTLGTSVQSMGYEAFRDCGFTGSLTIPSSVTSILNSAFQYCTGFDDDLTYLGTSDPGPGSGAFSSSSFTVCKVPSDYVDDTFCGLPIERLSEDSEDSEESGVVLATEDEEVVVTEDEEYMIDMETE